VASIRRGEIWWVDFQPAVGSVAGKTRPAIIVSNDASNQHMARVQVVPLTSTASHLYAFEAYVRVRGKQSKAIADQIMTADKSRLKKKVGAVTKQEMMEIERALSVQLGL
jgi:mRNA interferase MazF